MCLISRPQFPHLQNQAIVALPPSVCFGVNWITLCKVLTIVVNSKCSLSIYYCCSQRWFSILHISSKWGKLVALFPFHIENKAQTIKPNSQEVLWTWGLGWHLLLSWVLWSSSRGASLCPGGTRAPGPGLLGNSFLCLRSPAWLCVLPKACSMLTHPSVLGTLGCPCSGKAPWRTHQAPWGHSCHTRRVDKCLLVDLGLALRAEGEFSYTAWSLFQASWREEPNAAFPLNPQRLLILLPFLIGSRWPLTQTNCLESCLQCFLPDGGKHDEEKTGWSPCGMDFSAMEKSSLWSGSNGIVGENAPISLWSLWCLKRETHATGSAHFSRLYREKTSKAHGETQIRF